MSEKRTSTLRSLEAERKLAQQNLYQKFMHSEMTVAHYEHISAKIDRRYAKEQAFALLKAITENANNK